MPHSTASKPMLPGALIDDDCFIPDAPEQVPDSTKENDKIDDDSHAQESTSKNEVKLDDLCDDFGDDEDDELLGSGGSNSNDESSPPEAPL